MGEEILEELKKKAREVVSNLYDLCALIDLFEVEIRQQRKWRYSKTKVRWMVECLES